MIKRVAVFAYGLLGYAAFLGTFLYAIAFVGNFGVPKTLDGVPRDPLIVAMAINLGLLALFAVQHSVMARPWFKERWTRIVPPAAERSTYVLLSSLALILLFWQWRPMGGVVWSIENATGRAIMLALFAFGWALVLVATFLINHFDLFGLRQVWLYLRGKPYTALPFGTPGPYRLVRHPLYVGWLFAFWMTPTMTAAHLLFAVVTTAYILVAIQFEERDLVRALGSDYEEYRRRVPMIVPFTRSLRQRHKEEVISEVTTSLALGIVLTLLSQGTAYAWDITWTDQYGNGLSVSSAGAAADATGVYVAGSVTGAPLPGQTAAGRTDAYIRKYDFAGSPIWTHQYGTAGTDFGFGVSTDPTGVYVAGLTRGTLPGQTSAGNADAYVRKYSINGEVLWTRQFGTAAFDEPMINGIATHSTGVYVAGITDATFPGATPGNGEDIFLTRLDAQSGQVLWVRQFGRRGLASPGLGGVTVDDDAVYVAGTRILADTLQSIVRRYDFSGNLTWSRELDGNGNCAATFWGVATHGGNLYVTGQWSEDFFDNACGNGPSHIVGALLKYDSNGNLLWKRRIEGAGEGFGSFTGAKVIAASATGVYVAANLTSTFPGFISDGPDSDHAECPGLTIGNQFADSLDAYVRRYDFDGSVIWTHQFGSNVFDLVTALGTDATSLYVPVDTSCQIEDEPFSGGNRDVFFARMDINPTSLPGQVQLIVGRLETLKDANRFTPGEFDSLVKKLETTLRFLNSGDEAGAVRELQTFIHAVSTFQSRGTLTTSEANVLIAAANGILGQL